MLLETNLYMKLFLADRIKKYWQVVISMLMG